MQGISLQYIYNLSARLKPLSTLPKETAVKFSEIWLPLVIARQVLFELYGPNSLYGPYLRSSAHLADYLALELNPALDDPDMEREIEPFGLFQIINAFERFETVFLADLHSITTFLVTRKPPYDLISLLGNGEELFSSDLATKVPEAVFDARESGKALAFELPTACGFHAMRVTESVLRKYYTEVSGGRAKPKVRNISVYIHALESMSDPDEKVLSSLRQLNKLHRNPLIHPEAALTRDEATTLIGIAQSVVASMLARLSVPLPTTETAVIA